MLLHILRMPTLFQLAQARLKPENFSSVDLPYAVVWRAALSLAAATTDGLPPSKGFQRRLEGEVLRILEADPDVTEDIYTQLLGGDEKDTNGLLDWIFSFADSELDETEGTALLKKYLHDQLVVQPLKDYVYNLGQKVPEDISDMLRAVELQKQQIESIGDIQAESPITDLFEPMEVSIFPTNVQFLDDYMGGGQANGEAYVLLGPSGVGKTTMGVQLCCQGAKYSQQLYRKTRNPDDLRHWYFFSYEQPTKPDIYHRVWSHMGQIHIDTFRKGEPLSTSSSLKPYEKEKFREQLAQGLRVEGEKERFAGIARELDPKNLWLFDMSGMNDPTAGKGGVEEMSRILAKEAQMGRNIGGIVVDYAGLVADRYISQNNLSYDHLRHILRGFLDKVRHQISNKFNCPAWILHQLAGAANNKSPTAKQHHSDAAECKTFADNAWFAFSLGTKDTNNMCRVSCTKSRRSSGTTKEKVIFIDGAFCTMQTMDGQFVFDARTNKIISVNEQQQFSGPRPRTRTTPNPAAANGMARIAAPPSRNVDFDKESSDA